MKATPPSSRGVVVIATSAVFAMIAGCNALTGASSLELCGAPTDCIAVDASGADVLSDAEVLDAGQRESGNEADAGLDSTPNDLGCNGRLDCDRVIFATSQSYTGNLGGISGADLKCQQAADKTTSHVRVKRRKFMAWVSTTGSSAAARFPQGTGSYRLPSGGLVAKNWSGLVGPMHDNGIDESETGEKTIGESWTGTTASGASHPANCADWTHTTSKGRRGKLDGMGTNWTDDIDEDCVATNVLYCIEY